MRSWVRDEGRGMRDEGRETEWKKMGKPLPEKPSRLRVKKNNWARRGTDSRDREEAGLGRSLDFG